MFISLFAIMKLYISIATKYGLIDVPSHRSSHKSPTIIGGGMIFSVAILVHALLFPSINWYFTYAVLIISVVGFIDDVITLKQIPRFIFQSIAVILLLMGVGLLNVSPLYIIIVYVLVTGWLNTFNFMDGINGMTSLYSLVVLIGIAIFTNEDSRIPLSLVYSVQLAIIIFSFYNVRTKARVFAGDVGSLAMGLILAFMIIGLIVENGRWEFIIFVSIYGVDSVATIMHRLLKKENIFEAHRTHLYQYLANELEWSHLIVSFVYALAQLIIIIGLYITPKNLWVYYFVLTLVLISLLYIFIRFKVLNKISNKKNQLAIH